ncbi:MAG TPA: YggS family pyridoxal phosphate-dependent enzyme [Rubricoccaceae bacterium]|jgi:hypothetical protein
MSDPSDLARRVAAVHDAIATAATASGRAPEAVTLVAVTKTHPVETVRAALAAGLTNLGENRVQEMVEKAAAYPGAAAGGGHRWHLIGALQRNKARDAAQVADLVHGVDSLRLAEALGARATESGRLLPVLVQVNISGEASKSGVAPEAAHDLMAAVAGVAGLRLTGVMGIAAPASDAADAERTVRPAFRRLRSLFDTYTGPHRDALTVVSIGMSDDMALAVEEGSTLVRVGTALFGDR